MNIARVVFDQWRAPGEQPDALYAPSVCVAVSWIRAMRACLPDGGSFIARVYPSGNLSNYAANPLTYEVHSRGIILAESGVALLV